MIVYEKLFNPISHQIFLKHHLKKEMLTMPYKDAC